MDVRRSTVGATAAAVLTFSTVLPFCTSPVSAQTKDELKCVYAMGKTGARVVATRFKQSRKCVQRANDNSLPPGESAQQCLEADSSGLNAQADSKVQLAEESCSTQPAIAYAPSEQVITADDAVVSFMADVFGVPLEAGLGLTQPFSACQETVLERAEKGSRAGMKSTLSCIRREGIFGSWTQQVLDDCVYEDFKGKIERAEKKLRLAFGLARNPCSSVIDNDEFPGCPGTERQDCILAHLRCRTCEALRVIHGLTTDCDRVDDGSINGSCES